MRERTLWRRSVRVARACARQIRRGGVALLFSVPLAFGAMEHPSEATGSVLHVFTAERTRSAFLSRPATQTPRTLTLEVMREQFFQTEVPYGKIIYREALKNDLSPELVAAVVETESDFRPRLVSGKNAQGLMQIIPSTGRLLGADNLFNPEANVAAGAKYLRYLYDRFDDPRLALAAYNAGEGSVAKFGGIPPYSETRNYVARVNARTRQLRNRINMSYVLGSRVLPPVQ